MECEHDYAVIEDDIHVDEIRYGNGELSVEISGYVIFHCRKCLDIQKKVI